MKGNAKALRTLVCAAVILCLMAVITGPALTQDAESEAKKGEKQPVSRTVTFEVVNGAWDDGSTEDKAVTLSGYEGDALRLEAGQIPSVGSKPEPGYKAGQWSVMPSADTVIAEDTTFCYTYAQDLSAKAVKAMEDAKDDFLISDDEEIPLTSNTEPTPPPVQKPYQTISADDVNAAYGDDDVKIEAVVTRPAKGGGALSYTLKSGEAVSVDKTTGELTIHQVGKAVVTVTAAETASYRRTTKNVNVTIDRGEQTAPKKPVAIQIKSHDITISARTGEEYSIDGGKTWVKPKDDEDVIVFDTLEPDKDYSIIARMAETENYNPSPASEPLKVKTPLGTVKSEIIIDDNLPNVTVTGFDDDLAKKLCTPEDLKAVDDGAQLRFMLKITQAGDLPAGEKTLCDNAAAAGGGGKVGLYLDVSVLKTLGDAEPAAITDLAGNMIGIALDIPAQLRQVPANMQRSFFIIRAHDGIAARVPSMVSGNRIAFETDQFSTYALAYQDTVTQNPSGPASQNKGGTTAGTGTKSTGGTTNTSVKTGIDGNYNVYAALLIAGIAIIIGAAAFMLRRQKHNQ